MNEFKLENPHAIHFSGGRTSALMLRRHLDAHGGKLPEGAVAIFCNTGKERPETLDFVERCSVEWDVPVVWLKYRYLPGEKPDDEDAVEELPPVVREKVVKLLKATRKKPLGRHSFEVVNYASASRDGEPFEQIIRARGFLPNVVARFCTVEMKIRTAQRYLKSLGWEHWTASIGRRADEPRRVARLKGTNQHSREEPTAPLYCAGLTLADVRAFWEASSFDLGLLPYEGNCDLCFLKGRDKITTIMRERPDLAAWWIEQEQKIKLSRSARNDAFRADRPRYEVLLKQVQEQSLLEMFGDEPLIDCMCGGEE